MDRIGRRNRRNTIVSSTQKPEKIYQEHYKQAIPRGNFTEKTDIKRGDKLNMTSVEDKEK